MQAGTRLGYYEIVGPLGSGGMGEVYRARDDTLKREVAVKLVPDEVATDPDRVARLAREVSRSGVQVPAPARRFLESTIPAVTQRSRHRRPDG